MGTASRLGCVEPGAAMSTRRVGVWKNLLDEGGERVEAEASSPEPRLRRQLPDIDRPLHGIETTINHG